MWWARALKPSAAAATRVKIAAVSIPRPRQRRLHLTPPIFAVRPFVLADIGEGIRECEVIQWFVQPGARVEQFDKLCEVQSDKASVEITSRFDGVIKKLHYDAGDMALVGKPLVDIDMVDETHAAPVTLEDTTPKTVESSAQPAPDPVSHIHQSSKLATPAVRRICKELEVDIAQVPGSGKDGRVLKEDVLAFTDGLRKKEDRGSQAPEVLEDIPSLVSFTDSETTVPLTPIQMQMFKIMTKSLSIPHFLFSDDIHLDPLVACRSRINSELVNRNGSGSQEGGRGQRLSYMPFFIKAMSLALLDYPILNARLCTDGEKPALILRQKHNIGVAMDTPGGLVVPNIKNVQSLSIYEIGEELQRLQKAGACGKLSPADLKGGTITLSNIGNIGGRVVSPIIVENEVAILGIGKARVVPAFGPQGDVVPKTEIVLSWSADHRVIDGATMARMATLMKDLVENPDLMLARLK